MKISAINNYQTYNKQQKQPYFKAVNQKYYNEAKRYYDKFEEISGNWYQLMSYEVFLFKRMSKQDGIDTVEAVKKYIKKPSLWLEDLLNRFKNSPD